MVHEVRVYDGEGNLIRTVHPEFDPAPMPQRKFAAHPCPRCGESTTKRKYCYGCIVIRQGRST